MEPIVYLQAFWHSREESRAQGFEIDLAIKKPSDDAGSALRQFV